MQPNRVQRKSPLRHAYSHQLDAITSKFIKIDLHIFN
jgi:hypothetical protein